MLKEKKLTISKTREESTVTQTAQLCLKGDILWKKITPKCLKWWQSTWHNATLSLSFEQRALKLCNSVNYSDLLCLLTSQTQIRFKTVQLPQLFLHSASHTVSRAAKRADTLYFIGFWAKTCQRFIKSTYNCWVAAISVMTTWGRRYLTKEPLTLKLIMNFLYIKCPVWSKATLLHSLPLRPKKNVSTFVKKINK